MIKELLKSKNIKITPQRIQILESIKKLDLNATIKNIKENNRNIDNSTIYRILNTLETNNIVNKSINDNGEVYYQIVEGHEHYVVCSKCHKKEKIDICPITKIDVNGFEITNHKVEIIGLCNKCK